MSNNFTDTKNYASSLNLKKNVAASQNGASSTHNYVPLQPNPPASSHKLLPLKPNNKTPQKTQNIGKPASLSSQPLLSDANAKKRGSVSSDLSKQRKKPTVKGENNNNLNTLANIAVNDNENFQQSTPKPKPQIQQQQLIQPTSASSQPHQSSQVNTHQPAGHRPVTSCTHCRQHKIKCNASERFPASCQRCEKMGLSCEIDPQFRPRKGSQIQSLRDDVDELKLKIEYLQRNESLIAQALDNQQNSFNTQNFMRNDHTPQISSPLHSLTTRLEPLSSNSPSTSAKSILKREPQLLMDKGTPGSVLSSRQNSSPGSIPQLLNDSAPTNSDQRNLPPFLEMSMRAITPGIEDANTPHSQASATSNTNSNISEFVLGDVNISLSKANELHDIFIKKYLPFFPIMVSNSASELYAQSQLLFWTVCLTASMSNPDPTLYIQLASLIKQLAIETCWIRTPRSTHISQALLILCIWPLPNQKVLDDCSYRFVGLAKSLGYQLGLHRGEFMSEFSRTQVSLPDAEKWRTRTWLGIFFAEQFWASQLGLPPSLQTDYLIENARIDQNLPKNFRSLISLSIFEAKLVNVMGSSVVSPDGLMEARNRAGSLAILERELERLVFKLKIDDLVVEIYFLYIKLTVCCFAFLPKTPTEDQTKYVTIAYLTATRVITLVTKLLEINSLIELPIYIRQTVTYSAFILFKLHLTPLLLDRYIDSARQSIVTVHRLFRNQLAAWKNVENDISRTAQVLEKLNFVLFTHPELYTKNDGIITRMRSHLTGSLFYDLVWCIHEARRRTSEDQKNGKPQQPVKALMEDGRRPVPLPFYNQINKDDFQTITKTTPGGTTITTLAPTENAMSHATANATAAGLSKPTEIKGIPLSMLGSTGSIPSSGLSSANLNSESTNNSTNNLNGLRKVTNTKLQSTNQTQQINLVPSISSSPGNAISLGPVPFGHYDFDHLTCVLSPSNSNLGYEANNNDGNKADFDSFFQQQSAGWIEGNDDVLGWLDMNMAAEF